MLFPKGSLEAGVECAAKFWQRQPDSLVVEAAALGRIMVRICYYFQSSLVGDLPMLLLPRYLSSQKPTLGLVNWPSELHMLPGHKQGVHPMDLIHDRTWLCGFAFQE